MLEISDRLSLPTFLARLTPLQPVSASGGGMRAWSFDARQLVGAGVALGLWLWATCLVLAQGAGVSGAVVEN